MVRKLRSRASSPRRKCCRQRILPDGGFSEGTLLLEYPSEAFMGGGCCRPAYGRKLSGKIIFFSRSGGRLRFTFQQFLQCPFFSCDGLGTKSVRFFSRSEWNSYNPSSEEAEDVVVKFSQPRGNMTFHIPVPTGNYNAITVWFEDEGGNRLAWADGGIVSNPAVSDSRQQEFLFQAAVLPPHSVS